MPDKTKTVVVFESHEQTIIRRSRRTVSGQVLTDGAVAQPSQRASVRRWLAGYWRTATQKGARVFTPWSRRLKHSRDERRNKQPWRLAPIQFIATKKTAVASSSTY